MRLLWVNLIMDTFTALAALCMLEMAATRNMCMREGNSFRKSWTSLCSPSRQQSHFLGHLISILGDDMNTINKRRLESLPGCWDFFFFFFLDVGGVLRVWSFNAYCIAISGCFIRERNDSHDEI